MKKRKTYEVSVINKTYSKTISDETKFYTSDTALELNFQIKEVEYDFDSAEIILLNVDDRSLATRPVVKSAEGFTYELEADIVEHYGEWKGQLKFNEGGEIYVSSPVVFRIENDLNNDRPPKLTEVNTWKKLREIADKLIIDLQIEQDETLGFLENRQDTVESKFDLLQQEMTDKDVISAPEIIAARNGEANLKTRIDKDHQEVTAQLAQKVTQGNVSVSDINKNLGKFDQTYMSDEFLQQIAGNAPINTVPADYSLTLKKTTYSKVISANLFDKNSAENGRVDGTTGAFVADSIYYTSEHIGVTTGTTLKFSANVSRYAFYDANKTYLTGANLGTSITQLVVPSGAYYVRVTFYYTNLDNFMLAVGTLPASFEPFQMAISGRYLTDLSGDMLGDGTVSEVKTTFFDVGKNLANPAYLVSGYYVSSTDGSLKANADYSVYHMLPIDETESYAYNFDGQIAFYDINKTFISGVFGGGAVANKTLTTPSSAVFASFSTKTPNTFQVERGTAHTAFEPYALRLKKSLLPSTDVVPEDTLTINLPNKLYATVGEEFNIFTDNLLKEKGYNINYIASFGKQLAERFTYTPTTSGTQSLTIEVYERSKLVATRTVNILVSAVRNTPLKVMVIGDSTVRTDGFGYVTQRLKDKLGSNVELIGTMGTSPNLWEGRGGWRATTYRSNTSYEGVANPFYNPSTSDFDFSHYMSTQGFAGVNVVIINLGINDVFSPTDDSTLSARIEEVKSDFNFIVNNIKSYDTAIKVALNITIPPNDNQDLFGAMYGVGQTQWRYKYNNHEWVRQMIATFAGVCDLINTHSSIDTKNNIADSVHPKIAGYNQIGDVDVAYLNSLS